MGDPSNLPSGCTLGVNFTRLHDSAFAILGPDGDILFAGALERWSRLKQDGRVPDALLQCIDRDRIQDVAIGSSTTEDARALGLAHHDEAWGWRAKSQPQALDVAPHPEGCEEMYAALSSAPLRYDHHLAHAASAYYCSPFDEALILTCDSGAFQCPWHAAAYSAQGEQIELLAGVQETPPCTP